MDDDPGVDRNAGRPLPDEREPVVDQGIDRGAAALSTPARTWPLVDLDRARRREVS